MQKKRMKKRQSVDKQLEKWYSIKLGKWFIVGIYATNDFGTRLCWAGRFVGADVYAFAENNR